MLSLFPDLFTYGIFAPFILRLTIGAFFVLQGIRRQKEDSFTWAALWGDAKIGSVSVASILSKVQIVIGALLIIGLYTQAIVILAIAFIWAEWFKRTRTVRPSFPELWVNIFITAIAISLLFLGAGFLAFDLPL